MELEAFVTEIDDIQCSAERHDPFADADQPQSAAFRAHAILGGSTSIVLDRQRQPAPLRGGVLAGVLTEAESDTGLARMRVLVDVGQALLDDAIDVRRRRRRQHAQVAIDLER